MLTIQQDQAETLIEAAIAAKVLLSATYNRGQSVLAPHSLFTRHGELYLRAVTVERDGRRPKELKLGTFKLAGLSDLQRTRRLFSRPAVFAGLEPELVHG
ncbi:MAG TPA: hypothetical protein VF727_06125 [Allosphingosinicella sp.]|jgi:hypothetical protein